MRPWRAFLETVHTVSLGLWLGALVMMGAAAGLVFTSIRPLEPVLPAYSLYHQDHWRIAGGHVNASLFLATDIIQFICAMLATLSFAGLCTFCSIGLRRASTVIRSISLALALACVAGNILVFSPSANAALRAYWTAAQSGLLDEAAFHKAEFDKLHPIGTSLLLVTVACVLVTLILGVWTTAAEAASAPRTGERPASPLEEPRLLSSLP